MVGYAVKTSVLMSRPPKISLNVKLVSNLDINDTWKTGPKLNDRNNEVVLIERRSL